MRPITAPRSPPHGRSPLKSVQGEPQIPRPTRALEKKKRLSPPELDRKAIAQESKGETRESACSSDKALTWQPRRTLPRRFSAERTWPAPAQPRPPSSFRDATCPRSASKTRRGCRCSGRRPPPRTPRSRARAVTSSSTTSKPSGTPLRTRPPSSRTPAAPSSRSGCRPSSSAPSTPCLCFPSSWSWLGSGTPDGSCTATSSSRKAGKSCPKTLSRSRKRLLGQSKMLFPLDFF